MLQAKRAR